MKDQRRFFTFFIVLLSLSVILVGSYFAYGSYKDMNKSGSAQHNKDEQYPLRKNASEYQKEIHKELKEELKKESPNKALVSELVAKNFLADYFTWTNKLRFNDVGGISYVKKDYQSWVYHKSLDTFYNDLRYYLENDSVDKTLEVSSIQTRSHTTVIELDDKEMPAYMVEANWEYVPSSVLNLDEYQNKAFIKVFEDSDGHFSVVEVSANEEAEE